MINIQYKDRNKKKVEVFAANMVDIEKALCLKSTTDFCTKIPKHFNEYLNIADCIEADKLPPLCRPGINHHIKL